MAVESVSGYSWNECPDQRGISVRMLVEWVSGRSWDPHGDTRPTGRRPEQLYQLTDHAREQFPRQYQLLASALTDEVADIIGPEALATLMRNLGRKLAHAREQQVVDEAKIVQHMNQAGYEAEVFFAPPAIRKSSPTTACFTVSPPRIRSFVNWTWR